MHTPATVAVLVRARFLAFLLILSLLPVTSELIEAVSHYAEHGDLAHADSHAASNEHDSPPLGEDEHGCAGTFHLCACHTAVALAPSVTVPLTAFDQTRSVLAISPAGRIGQGLPAPDLRPPIS